MPDTGQIECGIRAQQSHEPICLSTSCTFLSLSLFYMAFSRLCFPALLVLLAREQYTTATGYDFPVHPLATLNGSVIASGNSLVSGNWAGSGATCTDVFGDFPCSCLALSLKLNSYVRTTSERSQYATDNVYSFNSAGSRSLTGKTTATYGGSYVYTQHSYPGPSPPGDCCEDCEVKAGRVHIIHWPVDTDNTTAQNTSWAGVTEPYTMVSDGFTL